MKAGAFQVKNILFLKSKLTLCVLFLFPVFSFSQLSLFSFTIADEKTKEPVQFCYVLVQGKNVSAQSDEKGNVSIRAKAEDTLVIYQLGYFPEKIRAAEIATKQNTILLKTKAFALEEVIVKSQRRDTLQNNNNTTFIDFDFYDDYILALADKGKKYNSLLLLDETGAKVSEKQLTVKTNSLFRDCFQNIHLLSDDSIYQVYYNYKELLLLPAYPISSYYNFLEPCECYNGKKYVFKVRHYHRLKNTYSLYDEEKKQERKIIACVADSQAIKGFNMDYDINYFLRERKKGSNYLTSVTEIKNNIDLYREELALPPLYKNLLRPVESEMKKIDTSFVLFDYTNQTSFIYSSNGYLCRKTTFEGFSDISPKLYIDYDAHNIVFSAMNKQGLLTLFRYDPVKNVFTHSYEISGFHFIKNFKIKANNLYFINKDRSTSYTKAKIVKEQIRWKSL